MMKPNRKTYLPLRCAFFVVVVSKYYKILLLVPLFAAGRFKMDLTSRKSSIKLMIQDELTKLADEADDEEDEGDAEKDETQPSGKGVKA